MCGIFGFSRLTPVARRMAPVIAIDLMNRGQDSYGVTVGWETHRAAGPETTNWWDPPKEWDNYAIVWHNRAASQRENASDPNCAHPFEATTAEGLKIVGVHNGVIGNWTDLNKSLSRKCKVDSEHIWLHRAEGKSWKELEGWGNLVWFEMKGEDLDVRLCRINDDALHVMELEDGTLCWCSRMAPVYFAGKLFNNPVKAQWKVEEGREYRLLWGTGPHGEDEIDKTDVKHEFSRRSWASTVCTPCTNPTPSTTTHTSTGPTLVSYCKKCFRNKTPNDEAFCSTCLADYITRFWEGKQGDQRGGRRGRGVYGL